MWLWELSHKTKALGAGQWMARGFTRACWLWGSLWVPIQDIPCFCNSVMVFSCALSHSTVQWLIIHHKSSDFCWKRDEGDFEKLKLKERLLSSWQLPHGFLKMTFRAWKIVEQLSKCWAVCITQTFVWDYTVPVIIPYLQRGWWVDGMLCYIKMFYLLYYIFLLKICVLGPFTRYSEQSSCVWKSLQGSQWETFL